jgi:YesN/AraC family two-component response regulator
VTPKKVSDMSVLILDDEELICDLIANFLETAFDFRSIITATTPTLAIQKIANQSFDIMIVDLNLQKHSGLEFINYLKDSGKGDVKKVILISGYFNEQNTLSAVKNGVKYLLVKPFTRQQMVAELSKILDIKVTIA